MSIRLLGVVTIGLTFSCCGMDSQQHTIRAQDSEVQKLVRSHCMYDAPKKKQAQKQNKERVNYDFHSTERKMLLLFDTLLRARL